MFQRILIAVLVIFVAAVLFILTPTGRSLAQEATSVFVTNFPQVQQITGDVAIKDPVSLAKLVSFKEITVPPVKPTETTRLVEAGTLTTEGFPSVVLSLHGQVKGWVKNEGQVGAILIPDEVSIQDAFYELGLIHFALQTTASKVSSQTPYFASDQPSYTVGFRNYKVLLFNTTDKTVTANLYAYLTN